MISAPSREAALTLAQLHPLSRHQQTSSGGQVMKSRRFTAQGLPCFRTIGIAHKGIAALQDFRPIYVSVGSITSLEGATGFRGMSPMPPIATELMSWGELTRRANFGPEHVHKDTFQLTDYARALPVGHGTAVSASSAIASSNASAIPSTVKSLRTGSGGAGAGAIGRPPAS
jgi:hypothetical protein